MTFGALHTSFLDGSVVGGVNPYPWEICYLVCDESGYIKFPFSYLTYVT